MASNEEYDPETAFLRAMQAQQDADEAELEPVDTADNTVSKDEENQTITPSAPHPEDEITVSDDDIEPSNYLNVANPVAEAEAEVVASPLSSKSSDNSMLLPQNGTAVLVNPSKSWPQPNSSPAASAEGTPDAQGETIDIENSGPFVIEDDDSPSVNGRSSGDVQNETATLSYPEQKQASYETVSAMNDSTDVQPSLTNAPLNSKPVETSSTVIQNAKTEDESLNPLTQQNKRKRLAQDVVGQLEDRISQDARGDLDAWLQLINEHQKKGKLEDARSIYEKFLAVFPTAAEQWVAYCQMELDANEFYRVEQIFGRCLMSVLNVELWSLYLDYIRRRNNLVTDTAGKARAVVSQAYEFVLTTIGHDREAGKIWQEYISFIKSGPGSVGSSNWQDQQKMDHLRKVYQRATCIPVNGVETMWKEYDQFEMGLNKTTGRKFISDKSPAYMTARSSLAALRNTTNGLLRTTLPRLPPVPGFDGYEEYYNQVDLWRKWIQWEKSDPLVLAQEPNPEDIPGFNNRVLYVYKQALMALRFWPEIWYEASEFCFSIDKEKEAVDFLKDGMKANPESCLLHFRYAEYLEVSTPSPSAEDKEAVKRRSGPVREVYDQILDVYYNLINRVQEREKEHIARLEDTIKQYSKAGAEDDDDENYEPPSEKNVDSQIALLKDATKKEMLSMSKIVSAIWISLMRTMRRMEGHGKVGDIVGGSRQIFTDARKRGKITSDVYVASALMEYHCYKDPSANRIFDRGLKIFPDDEDFALEYLRHLIATNDITNARAVFETFVGKITSEKADGVKRVFQFFYDYESQYGEIDQVLKLEKRLKELYPQDPQLKLFSGRYAYKIVNPSAFLPVVSTTQIRPKGMRQEQRQPASVPDRSPKRLADDSDGEAAKNERPRKIQRGESPLKGAAGRRLMDQKRAAAAATKDNSSRIETPREFGQQPQSSHHIKQQSQPANFASAPPTIPDAILFLLSILPPARAYNAVRFKPEEMVKLLLNLNLPLPPPIPANGVSHFCSSQFLPLLNAISENQLKAKEENLQHVNEIMSPSESAQNCIKQDMSCFSRPFNPHLNETSNLYPVKFQNYLAGPAQRSVPEMITNKKNMLPQCINFDSNVITALLGQYQKASF